MSGLTARATRVLVEMTPDARHELATESDATDALAVWQVARDMGVSVGELESELYAERAMVESWDKTPRQPLEAGAYDAGRNPAMVAWNAAYIRAMLATPAAVAGRAMLASYGHRTDVVIVTRATVDGVPSLNRAVRTGNAQSAAKRASKAAAKLDSVTAAWQDVADKFAVVSATATGNAVARAGASLDRATARQRAAADTLALAKRCHLMAALWADVPECKPEILEVATPEFFASHAAPADVVPSKFRDVIRVHADRAPSDITGKLAALYVDTANLIRARGALPYESADHGVAQLVNAEILRDDTRAKLWRDVLTGTTATIATADKAAASADRAAARAARKVAARRASRAASRAK